MPLKAGSNYDLAGFATSMAGAMEAAFKAEWPSVMGDAPVPDTAEKLNQMRLFFTAIAQGVVKHLQEHATDFEVTVTDSGTGIDKGTVTKIN